MQVNLHLNMKFIIVSVLSAIMLYGCSNSNPKTGNISGQPQQNQLEITNDMEDAGTIIPSWINEKTVILLKEPAPHSGNYACITNDTVEYGYGYMEKIKNIVPGLPKTVLVSGWIYTTVKNPNLAIILDVSENEKQYDWKAFPLADSLSETGKWIEFSSSFYFDKQLNPEQTIKIFPWNQEKQPIYFDDFKIIFEY